MGSLKIAKATISNFSMASTNMYNGLNLEVGLIGTMQLNHPECIMRPGTDSTFMVFLNNTTTHRRAKWCRITLSYESGEDTVDELTLTLPIGTPVRIRLPEIVSFDSINLTIFPAAGMLADGYTEVIRD